MESWMEEMEFDAIEFAVRDYSISSAFLMETIDRVEGEVPLSIKHAVVQLSNAIVQEWGVEGGRTG